MYDPKISYITEIDEFIRPTQPLAAAGWKLELFLFVFIPEAAALETILVSEYSNRLRALETMHECGRHSHGREIKTEGSGTS